MTEDLSPAPVRGSVLLPPESETDMGVGYSDSFSFKEAFLNAVKNLPPFDPFSDYLDTVRLTSAVGEFGGFAGVSRLKVTVARPRSERAEDGAREGERGQELCNEGGNVAYRAVREGERVLLRGEGEHGTPGFGVYFKQASIDIFPPEFLLLHERPGGLVSQVVTPFHTETELRLPDSVTALTVHDAKGKHAVVIS